MDVQEINALKPLEYPAHRGTGGRFVGWPAVGDAVAVRLGDRPTSTAPSRAVLQKIAKERHGCEASPLVELKPALQREWR